MGLNCFFLFGISLMFYITSANIVDSYLFDQLGSSSSTLNLRLTVWINLSTITVPQ